MAPAPLQVTGFGCPDGRAAQPRTRQWLPLPASSRQLPCTEQQTHLLELLGHMASGRPLHGKQGMADPALGNWHRSHHSGLPTGEGREGGKPRRSLCGDTWRAWQWLHRAQRCPWVSTTKEAWGGLTSTSLSPGPISGFTATFMSPGQGPTEDSTACPHQVKGMGQGGNTEGVHTFPTG